MKRLVKKGGRWLLWVCVAWLSSKAPSPGSLTSLARPRHLAADSQKHDPDIRLLAISDSERSVQHKHELQLLQSQSAGFWTPQRPQGPPQSVFTSRRWEKCSGGALVWLHETLMRPKVHLLGFHVWMEARRFLDRSLIPMWSVRGYFGRGELETEIFGVFEPGWQSQCEKRIICPGIFKEEREKKLFCYCWFAVNWLFCANCTGSTTLVLKGLRHEGNLALLLFPHRPTATAWHLYPSRVTHCQEHFAPYYERKPHWISSSASLTTCPAPRSANSDFSYVWRGWSHRTP